jgi:exodeoxyribonuclease VII large subunit
MMLPDDSEPMMSVSEFVALLNQTFEYAFPNVTITGELANMRISKGKWLYFDLKDEGASVKFFGTVYQLPGPLEDGMLVKVRGLPRLHSQYGFSVTVQNIQPTGEGAIRRAADLLKVKLAAEGLFDHERKRPLPYPPRHIGLITSAQSAAYADFTKILAARWSGLTIELIDVQVQGEPALEQIVGAIEAFNALAKPPDVLVLIRGGGSVDDMAVFSSERVTRAVATSRIPTMVAIGHETDVCLAELAADYRASTPSNAAELLVPDRAQTIQSLHDTKERFTQLMQGHFTRASALLEQMEVQGHEGIKRVKHAAQMRLTNSEQLLKAYDPTTVLRRGYAIVRQGQKAVRHGADLVPGAIVNVQLADVQFDAAIAAINMKNE